MKMKTVTLETLAKRQRFRFVMTRWLSVFLALGLLIWGISPWVRVGININHSLHGLIYIIVKGADIQRGDDVAFWPPDNPYYHTWFVKIAKGVHGDLVEEKNRHFYINHEWIGYAKEKTKAGRVLKMGFTGIIPEGYIFVWTPHPDSYDSRYDDIGLIKDDQVIGRAYRIL